MTQRLVPLLTGLLATVVFGGLLTGTMLLPLLAAGPIGALLLYRLVIDRRPAPPEQQWSPAEIHDPVLAAPDGESAIAMALGRAESRHLVLSPWFGIALGFLAIFLVSFGMVFADDSGEVWHEVAAMLPWFAHPVAGMTIVAVHRAATRPARDGSEELFESCPAEPVVRVFGLLLTAVVPVAAFAGFLVLYGAFVAQRSSSVHGPFSTDTLPLVFAGLVLVTGAVCLGVALGSWVRFGLAPVVAVVGIGMLALGLMTNGDPGWNRLAGLSTFGPTADSPLLQPLLPTWWYLLWLVALCFLVAIVAITRFRRTWPVRLAAIAGVAVAVAAASLATAGPSDGDARQIAELIARPSAYQSCDAAGGLVDVCTYPEYGELRERVVAAVGAVGRALPEDAPAVTLRQGFLGTEKDLPPEVVRLLPDGIPPSRAGEVRIGFAAGGSALLEYRLLVAFAALGLRLPADAPGDGPLVIAGEARGVVALWLAARGLDPDEAVALATAGDRNPDDDPGNDVFDQGLAWPEMCGPVVWAPEDLSAARALIRAPEAKVAAVVEADFERWSGPSTPTNELLAAVGLPAVGPASKITPQRESFC